MRHNEQRRHERRGTEAAITVMLRDSGAGRRMSGRGIDISQRGARIQTAERLEPGTYLTLHCEGLRLLVEAVVRHSAALGAVFVSGLEFAQETVVPQENFVDYYEVLQISRRAEPETIHRVFRMMATRFHPDNPETGNIERFMLLKRAYETLGDPERRMAYDAMHPAHSPQPIPLFAMREFVDGVEGENNRRLGILCLLYNQRKGSPDSPALSLLDLEQMMAYPREYLAFTLWFLREKSFIRVEENSSYAITAEGVECVERTSGNRIIYKLLKEPARPGERTE